jgi:hypothetical protein
MRNRRNLSLGKGIVATVSRQLCSSLLHNWLLNTHYPYETFRTQEMKAIRVLP